MDKTGTTSSVISPHIPDMELPDGQLPPLPEVQATPEVNDAWHLENHRLRVERGDFERSDTPVEVRFEMR